MQADLGVQVEAQPLGERERGPDERAEVPAGALVGGRGGWRGRAGIGVEAQTRDEASTVERRRDAGKKSGLRRAVGMDGRLRPAAARAN